MIFRNSFAALATRFPIIREPQDEGAYSVCGDLVEP